MNDIVMNGMYFGTVDQVLAPDSDLNVSKYQYEYIVLVTCELYSQLQVRCIGLDPYGSFNNFMDTVYSVGHRVFIMFPKGDRTLGVIMGGSRFYGPPTPTALGIHQKRRFNELEESYTKEGFYRLASDDGPNWNLRKEEIVLDDSVGEKITLDKKNKKILIECKDWEVQVKGNCTINVVGKADVHAAEASVTVDGKASVKAGTAAVEVQGETTLKSGGNVKIDGANVMLNGPGGKVLTTKTQPLCYVTGIPFVGEGTVKAG